MKIGKKIASAAFNYIHNNNLVYNTCWEDPFCDRQLLDIQKDSKVVMITSAGCNALDYLLDNPAEVHCVDMNPRQNALLELKLSAYGLGSSHEDLFQMFGEGRHESAANYYAQVLRSQLNPYAQQYWDKHIGFFDGKGIRKSFYHHGTSGIIAFSLSKYVKYKQKFLHKLRKMMHAESLEEQKAMYEEIEPKLFNKYIKWLMNRHLVMCMLGVPQSQQELFEKKYTEGAFGFIQSRMHNVFTQIPFSENYFWKVYIEGHYSKDCCPNYLKDEHYEDIQQNRKKVKTYNATLSSFLQDHPGWYSHFVLLDHQDWLAHHYPDALEEEWKLILNNSRKGTKILLRSASEEVNFFPDFIKESVVFEKEKTSEMHKKDRVGTYASVYLGVVK
ncbi:MAG: DUF3419 family protein [Saprospiraceae bacterium]